MNHFNTLGAEILPKFAKVRREKFYIDRFAKVYGREIFNFFFFSPNLLAALDNSLILVSWRKKSRPQCNTKMRSVSIAILSLRKVFGARKRGLIRQKLEIIRFFSLFYFSGSKRFLKTTKKFNFSVHSRKFKMRKILFWPFRESLSPQNAKMSRIFPLAKVYAPKVHKMNQAIVTRSR